MLTENRDRAPENTKKYMCEICNFTCSKQSDYNRHLSTAKHLRLSTANQPTKTPANVCACGEKYMHKSSLSRHKKTCTYISSPKSNPSETLKSDHHETHWIEIIQLLIKENQEIRNLVIKENQEIRNLVITQNNALADQNKTIVDQHKTLADQNKTLAELVKNQQPTTNNSHNNNNNQNYNINMFLTDKCKDAQNMSDFIEVLKNKVDMIQIYEKGYVGGISKLFIDELRSMEITERPIHCTDERRNTFYVHNNDTWNKDEDLKDTKKAISHISQTNLQQCVAWSKNVPEGGASREEHITRSIRLCKEACSGDDTKVDKIIKNISKEIPLNKQVINDVLV
jgi:hypothetical protein